MKRNPPGICEVSFRQSWVTLRRFMTWFKGSVILDSIMRRFIMYSVSFALDNTHRCGVIHTGIYYKVPMIRQFQSLADIKPRDIIVQIRNDSVFSEFYLPNNPADRHLLAHPREAGRFQPSPWNGTTSGTEPTSSTSITLSETGEWRAERTLISARLLSWKSFRAGRMFNKGRRPDGRYRAKCHLHEIGTYSEPFRSDSCRRGTRSFPRKYFIARKGSKSLLPLNRWVLNSEAFLEKLNNENEWNLVRFLRFLTKINPEERETTAELLAEPWLDGIVCH